MVEKFAEVTEQGGAAVFLEGIDGVGCDRSVVNRRPARDASVNEPGGWSKFVEAFIADRSANLSATGAGGGQEGFKKSHETKCAVDLAVKTGC